MEEDALAISPSWDQCGMTLTLRIWGLVRGRQWLTACDMRTLRCGPTRTQRGAASQRMQWSGITSRGIQTEAKADEQKQIRRSRS